MQPDVFARRRHGSRLRTSEASIALDGRRQGERVLLRGMADRRNLMRIPAIAVASTRGEL